MVLDSDFCFGQMLLFLYTRLLGVQSVCYWIQVFVSIDGIIQLLTIESLNMMRYPTETTNIDRGEAEVNIGSLCWISHHIQ